MILVIEAGATVWLAFFSYRISFVSKSITIACSALVSTASAEIEKISGNNTTDKTNKKKYKTRKPKK